MRMKKDYINKAKGAGKYFKYSEAIFRTTGKEIL